MRYYLNSDGTKTPIAGRGKAEYGASTVRTGTSTAQSVTAGTFFSVDVTFDTPMPNADYVVEISHLAVVGEYSVWRKTANGFRLSMVPASSSASFTFDYTAFKLYTDTEYNKLLTVQSGTTSDSHVTWTRSGNVVAVSIYGFVGTGSNVTVTGLPKCAGYALAQMCASGTATPTGAIQISTNDTSAIIMAVPNGTVVYGSVTYITSDPL